MGDFECPPGRGINRRKGGVRGVGFRVLVFAV